MFGFDMLIHGVHGDQLLDEDLTKEELEVYGVDWERLQDEQLLHSQRGNNSTSEGWNSWIGHVGPPDHLNEVSVDPPVSSLFPGEVDALDQVLETWMHTPVDGDIIALWTHGLAYVQLMHSNLF